MGQMFRSFISFICAFFSVLEKTAKSFENLADVAVATSGEFKDSAEEDRKVSKEEADFARQKRRAAIAKAKAAEAVKVSPKVNTSVNSNP